ncbi:MAG: hypothetical protein JW904_12280 [Spirochaetales bacterium]|nr:hypothetical protein [Spirochaetales bacterium]
MENEVACTVSHDIPRNDLVLGICCVRYSTAGAPSAQFEERLARLLQLRKTAPLSAGEEAVRLQCRDFLRNGIYKPTGRGKPSSEYLLRTAAEGNFPRINYPVDVNNFISLSAMAPVSLWDMQRAKAGEFVFRLGKEREEYVFNSAGQLLSLHDLVTGCAVSDTESCPIVTPVKDSMAAKIQESTQCIAACIYYPVNDNYQQQLTALLKEFVFLLTNTIDNTGSFGIVERSETKTVTFANLEEL